MLGSVAPLAGAWVEIFVILCPRAQTEVAPLAGAWVEIIIFPAIIAMRWKSLPLRERGLKCIPDTEKAEEMASLPLRERGLKYRTPREKCALAGSLPLRERGLKYNIWR